MPGERGAPRESGCNAVPLLKTSGVDEAWRLVESLLLTRANAVSMLSAVDAE